MIQLEDNEQHLSGIIDRFNGIKLDVGENKNWEKFAEKLATSMEYWKSSGVRGVSLHIPIEFSELIPICVQHDLDFHHAKPGHVMMTTWLPDGEQSMIPPYPHTFIGVGGFVVNDNNEVLVVRERCGDSTMWKLPGGGAERGECPEATACREVAEETGVKTEFDYVLCFRHMTEFSLGCDDIYIVCVLRPLTTDIQHDPREIAECRWMPIDEYITHKNTNRANRFIGECYLKSKHSGLRMSMTSLRKDNFAIYHLEKDETVTPP